MLPIEVIFMMLGYLDFPDVIRLATLTRILLILKKHAHILEK